jgi:hypothetical protein
MMFSLARAARAQSSDWMDEYIKTGKQLPCHSDSVAAAAFVSHLTACLFVEPPLHSLLGMLN